MDDDEDKDFTESFGDQTLTGEGTRPVEAVPNNLIQNQPYDESVEISDPEEVPSNNPTPRDPNLGRDAEVHPQQNMMALDGPSSNKHGAGGGGLNLPDGGKGSGSKLEGSSGEMSGGRGGRKKKVSGRGMDRPVIGGAGRNGTTYNPEDDDDDDSEQEQEQSESEETEESEAVNTPLVGVYDPNEYAQLPVSKEIKDLFKHITRYKPQVVHLETKLKPFIPELIPAIGDIDAFLKVQRPGERPENMGLSCLDEPKVKQSDPTLLDLTLRTLSKQTTVKPMTVRSIEDPEKQVKDMDAWTTSISELHRQKPATSVHYSRNMPDIENLMQEWPANFQESLKEVEFLPNAEMSCELKDFVDIVCALTDIPIYKSRVQALHVFFSLYLEFKNSQHFQSSENDPEGVSMAN